MSEEKSQYIEINGKELALPPLNEAEKKRQRDLANAQLTIKEADANIKTAQGSWKLLAEDPDYPDGQMYETPNGIYVKRPSEGKDMEKITQVAPTESAEAYKARQAVRFNKGE